MSEQPIHQATTNPRHFIDLFAGCGGLSLGLMQAGWKALFSVERDPMAFETLSFNFGQNPLSPFAHDWPNWLPKGPHEIGAFIQKHRADLRTLRGQVDLIAGGPPCQGFSMAGRRQKDDPRNQLFRHYIEVVRLVRPRFLILENVKGISVRFAEAEGGPTNTDQPDAKPFSEIIEEGLGKLRPGYKVFGGLVRASDFGVPQLRPRFIMFGIRRDVWRAITIGNPGEEINPHVLLQTIRTDFLQKKGLSTPVSCSDAIGDFVHLGRQESSEMSRFQELVYKAPADPAPYVRLMRSGMDERSPNSLRMANHRPEVVNRWRAIFEDPELRRGVKFSAADRQRHGIEGKHSFAVLDPNQPSHTLTTLPDDLLHYQEPRILTVRECARLQSFPDWFEFRGKYTTGGERRTKEAPRYTQVGNAVPPLLAEVVGRVLMILDRMANGQVEHE